MRDLNVTDVNELIDLLSQSSEVAFRKIYDMYAPFVLQTLVKITKSIPDSEEAVQDIFVGIWKKRESLNKLNDFKSYLFIVSRNYAINILKKQTNERLKHEKWQIEELIDTDEDNTTLEKYYNLLDEAVQALPPQQKTAYLLHKYQFLKYDDIAEQMSISKESVKKYLKIAKLSIKKRFLQSVKEIRIFFL